MRIYHRPGGYGRYGLYPHGSVIAVGLSALTCFSIVGNTVARFFSELGIETAGGVPAGVTAHYVVGPLFGAIYGAAVMRIAVFNLDTLREAVLGAILYAEILRQTILATTPFLLNMTAYTTLKWYGGTCSSFQTIPHAIQIPLQAEQYMLVKSGEQQTGMS